MPPKMTLVEICISKVVTLLKKSYWPVGNHDFEDHNPFAALPSDINEQIIAAVVQKAHSATLTFKDLYPILVSGRVKNFELEHILIDHEELVCILTAISVQAFQLNVLILDEIRFPTTICAVFEEEKISRSLASAIECLISVSPNLRSIRIGIMFDLRAVQNIYSLKHLELNFVPRNGLYDIIPKIDDSVYIPNDTITLLSIIKTPEYTIPSEEIAFVLKYCTELKYCENNIAEGLQLCHGDELADGTLSTQYKIEKIVLGNTFSFTCSAVASASVIHIASITCPLVKEIDVLVNDHKAVDALRDFKNLECILIQWELVVSPGDFRLGMELVIKEIGINLNKLCLINFCNVNFGIIGHYCPNLKTLKMEYDTEVPSSEVLRFEYLEHLHLECISQTGAKEQTLLELLSFCKDISYLYLESIVCFDDNLMEKLLSINGFANLKEAYFIECSLTEVGLAKLVRTCESLEFLKFFSINLSFEMATEVVHSINPFIIICF